PDQILNIARESLTAIGYWPLPAALAPAIVPATPAAPAFEPPITEASAESVVPVDPALIAAIETPAPAFAEPPAPVAPIPVPRVDVAAIVDTPALAPAAPAPKPAAVVGERLPGYDVASNEDVDAEIQEVFLEEFSEEIENLGTLLPAWAAKLDNVDALRPIRRVFHTLKGSGRLVGAKALGEFSWKIENMLNRVLDGTRPPTQAVHDIVAECARVLPDLRAALAGEERYADLDGLKAIADRVAAGEEAHYVAPAAHAPEPDAPIQAAAPAIEPVPSAPAPIEPPPLPEVHEVAPDVPVVRAASHWPMLPAYEAVPEGVSFALDPVLLEILRPEVEGHLEVVDEWLARSEAQGPQRIEERLLRSVHTMNGAFAMTEVSAITGVTSPLEGFLKRLISAQALPSAEDVVLVRQATYAVRQTLDALADPEARLPQFPALAAALQAVRDALPEPGSPVLSLGDDDTIVAVDMGGIDTAEVPRFDAPAEPVSEATAPEASGELAPADAQDPERLTLDSFLEAPLPVAFDIAESESVAIEPSVDVPVDATHAADEASIAAALPPVDDRAEEAAYTAELAVLKALADAEAAAAVEQAARAQAERDARVAAEAAMALAIAEAAAAEAAAAESAAAAQAEAAAVAEAQAAERAAQDAEAAAMAAELAAFEQAEREARAAAEQRAREQSEREAAAFAQMQAELAEQAARAQAEQEAREAEAREAEARA
ncbi:MAG: Hpt domain-containing protein, partial [Silanimonas sp.]